MKFYQQGDVLIIEARLPESLQKVKATNGRNVVAEGEATGHAHVLSSRNSDLFTSGNDLFLSVSEDCLITHEEHKSITIPPGHYKVSKVREYDHFLEESREVRD